MSVVKYKVQWPLAVYNRYTIHIVNNLNIYKSYNRLSLNCCFLKPSTSPFYFVFGYCVVTCDVTDNISFCFDSYIKKVIEDPNLSEESVKLLQFCSWENPIFSRNVLSELLWQISYAYSQDLKHHVGVLLHLLLMEDSWQTHRVHNALHGVTVPETKEGLFDIINRSKNHYQKRAYQCIKCMTTLFSTCRAAHNMLMNNMDMKNKWHQCIDWLQHELEMVSCSKMKQF